MRPPPRQVGLVALLFVVDSCLSVDRSFVLALTTTSTDLYTNVDQSVIAHLRRLFEQRPVWTRNSLLFHLKISEVILKRIIHHVAYFFCNGPWNRCWVKYAYDPRTDAHAKIYQIVDYRVRAVLDPEKNLVKSRTSRAYHRSSSVRRLSCLASRLSSISLVHRLD
jgi:hypothetical protein